jgi:4-hydroxy-tetrahydrodipicolinate synthase
MRGDHEGSILARDSPPQVTSRPIPTGFSALQLHGSITALATPFGASGDVDFSAWNRLLERQLAGGTQAIVVAGSTGEAPALEDDEYARLLEATAELVAGRIPVLAGTGLSNTAKTVRQCRFAREHGADIALVVTPPYVRPTQDGLRAHYLEVAERGDVPIVLYNVPGRTGCDLLPDTVAKLAPHPAIVGIKEARAEPERMQALLGLKRESFAVLSGDDPTACRALIAGADGVISVASNAIPASFRALVDLARGAQADAARQLDAELQPLFERLGVEPNPIPVKAVLAALGLCHDVLRLPLQPLSPAHRHALESCVAQVRAFESRHQPRLAA